MARRVFDVTFALLCLVILLPLIVMISVLIKLESRGPVLYAPWMVGKDGRQFRLWRFRTMRAAGPTSLSPTDRLTRVGRFVRNYSLDHLPTVVNVLKGDLSVTGPRPMELEFVDLHDPVWRAYFQVKPGLFNYGVLKLGMSYGHSSAGNMALKQKLELEYIQKQSLWFDLKLFADSIWAHVASGGNVKLRGKPDPALRDSEEQQ